MHRMLETAACGGPDLSDSWIRFRRHGSPSSDWIRITILQTTCCSALRSALPRCRLTWTVSCR